MLPLPSLQLVHW